MQGARHQLLARAGFARDEHRGTSSAHQADYFHGPQHGAARAHQEFSPRRVALNGPGGDLPAADLGSRFDERDNVRPGTSNIMGAQPYISHGIGNRGAGVADQDWNSRLRAYRFFQ